MAAGALPAAAQSFEAGGNVIIPDGRTATQLSTNGATTDITTGTMAGGNAYNSFTQFKVGENNTVNLHVPGSAEYLVNIVRDGPVVVDGTLNALKDGRIDGNIVFSDPYGFIVSEKGVVNAGSLTVNTPTKEFLEQVIDPSGRIDTALGARLIDGDVPLSPDGSIIIRGKVKTKRGVFLKANTVTIEDPEQHAAQFEATVNTSGRKQGAQIVVRNGKIQIVAAGNARIGGKLRAGGGRKTGGSIRIVAADEITILPTARIEALRANEAETLFAASDDVRRASGGRVSITTVGNLDIGGSILAEGSAQVGGAVNLSGANVNLGVGAHVAATAVALPTSREAALEGPRVRLGANGNATVAGAISADGADGVSGGSIEVRATADIALASTAKLSANGFGASADGGTIIVFADRNLAVGDGVTVHAAAGTTGDGGFIELSAKKLVELATLDIDLGARSGKAGRLLIDPEDVVFGIGNTPGTTYFASQLTNGFTYEIQAGNSITIKSGFKIDTRKLDGGLVSTGDSGDVILSAPHITIENGAEIDASVTAGSSYSAGDVSLLAEQTSSDVLGRMGKTDTVDSSITIAGSVKGRTIRLSSLADYTVKSWHAGTTSTITISGTLSGTAIDVMARARAVSDYNDHLDGFGVLGKTLTALNPLGLDAAWVSASAKAYLNVEDAATISGANVKLQSEAIGVAQDSSVGLNAAATTHMSIPVIVGMVESVARTDIGQAVQLTASESLGVSATTDTKLNILSSVISGMPFAGSLPGGAGATVVGAVAYGSAKVDASAILHSNTAIAGNGSVTVLARSENAFAVNAKAYGRGQAQVGGTLAISEIDSKTVARLGASVDNTGAASERNVTVQALSNVAVHETSASTTVGTGGFSDFLNGVNTIGNLIGGADLDVSGMGALILAKLMATPAATATTLGSKTAGSLSIAHGSITADASIAGDGGTALNPSVKAKGKVTVVSDVYTRKVVSSASSAVNSSAVDDLSPTSTSGNVGSSVAVAIFDVGHYSRAYLGGGAGVEGTHVGINASMSMNSPILISDWDSFGQVFTDFANAYIANPGVFTSGAKATAESTNSSQAGSYNHFRIGADTTAWVGKGARIVSTGGAGNWSVYRLDALDTPDTTGGQPDTFNFQNAVDINATTELESLNVMGNWGLSGNTSGGAAVGGSAGYLNFDVATIAGIADSANVTAAQAIEVEAKSTHFVLAISPSNGSGKSVAGSGLFSLVRINDKTQASISNRAQVTADVVSVEAEEVLGVYAGAGQLQYGNGASIGVGIAIVDIDTDTAAYVGSNLGQASSAVDAQTVATANAGRVTTNELNVRAVTSGTVLAMSIAATLSQPVEAPPAGSPSAIYKMLMSPSALVAPKFNLTISGSSSAVVNALATRAYLDGATVARRSGSAGQVAVQALNTGKVYSLSGSAAISVGGGPSPGSAALAGALALGSSDNRTIASIDASDINDMRSVVVQGLAGGSYTVSAVGLTASSGNSSLASLAGSVSIALIEDTVQGTIRDSDITAPAASPGSLTVHAYRRTEVSIGGGALGIGGKAGAGVGLTFTTIRDSAAGAAALALISNSNVTGYVDLSVVAAAPSRIYSGAAAASILATNGFSGAFIFNDIGGTVMASIEADQDNKDIDVSGAVNVKSGTANATDLNNLLDAATRGGPSAINDYSRVKYENADNGAVTEIAAGAAIVSIAGNISVGDNNIGASVIDNSIAQHHVARIAGVEIDADGLVTVAATDTTSILAIGVGVGVATGAFAGQAAIVNNSVGSSISAEVGKDGRGTDIDAGGLAVTAQDAVVIRGSATSASISAGTAGSIGIAVNSIAMDVGALVNNATINTSGSVELAARSTADILTVAMGISGGSGIALAGSAASSKIATHVRSRVLGGSIIDAENNVIVEARNDGRISVVSGAAGVGLGAGGGGISTVVNQIGGDTEASIADSTVDADGDGADKSVSAGDLVAALSPGDVTGMGFSTPDFTQKTKTVSGVAVVANSVQTVTGVVVTLGIAGGGPAAAILPIVTVAGGKTVATIDRSNIGTQLGAASEVTVSASSHSFAGNLAIGGAVSASATAGAGVGIATTMNRRTESWLSRSNVGAVAAAARPSTVTVEAVASQSASDIGVGLSAGLIGGGTATAIVTVFNASTQAFVEEGSVRAGSADVAARSTNGYFSAAGSAGAGLFGGKAGAFGVGVSRNVTVARIGATGKTTTLNLNGDLDVSAKSYNAFTSNAYGAAGAVIGAPVAAMALVTVVGNETQALLRDATINIAAGATVPTGPSTTRPAGITLTAFEELTTRPYTGGGGVTLFGSGIGAAANVVVLTSKVQADSTGGNISAPGDFDISATTEKHIDARTVTVGMGLGGGIGAAVAVVIAGGATAADAMAELNNGGNGTLANINATSAAAADFVLDSDTLASWRARASGGGPAATDAQVQAWARARYLALIQGGSFGNDGTYIPDPQLPASDQAVALSDYTLLARDRTAYVLADNDLLSYSGKALDAADQAVFAALAAINDATGIDFVAKPGTLSAYAQEAQTALGLSVPPTEAQISEYLEQRYQGFVAAIRARADADYSALIAKGDVTGGRLVVRAAEISSLASAMLSAENSSLYSKLVAARTAAAEFALTDVDAIYEGAKTFRQFASEELDQDLSGASNDQKVQEFWRARYDGLTDAIASAADDSYRNMVASRFAAGQNFSVTNAANNASEGVYAGIAGGVVAVRDIAIDAISAVSVSNMATGVGASGFGNGVGAAVAFTESNATVSAYAAGNITAHTLALNALARDGGHGAAADTEAYAGAGGMMAAIGAAAAVSKANNNVTATIGGTITGSGQTKAVLASAMDVTTIESEAVGATFGGGAALGASIATSHKSSSVAAGVTAASNVSGWDEVQVSAATGGALYSKAIAGAGGIGSALAGAVATSVGSETVTASIGNGSTVSAGTVNVAATAMPKAVSETIGVVVSGGNAMGVSMATSQSDATITAYAGDNVTVTGGGLNITAISARPLAGDTAWARAAAGSGGVLMGLNATVARAIGSSKVKAYGGRGLRLPNGNVAIGAVNDGTQVTESTGIAVGFIGAGATVAETRSTDRSEAWLEDGAITSAARAGGLSISASGKSDNYARSVAGAGGVIAGAASVAITKDESVSLAELRSGTAGYTLYTGGLAVEARRDYDFTGIADAFQASAVGASGAAVDNDMDSDVTARVGAGMVVHSTDDVYITATTMVKQDGGGARAGSGGMLAGAASLSDTDITNDSTVDIGAGSVISLNGDPTTFDGKIDIEVFNQLQGGDTVSLETGGFFAGGGGEANFDATITNKVNVGANAHLFSVGALQIGTASVNTVANQANAGLYGVVTGAGASSYAEVDVTQQVNIGAAAKLEAFGNLAVTAGQTGNGYFGSLVSTSATTEVYNYAVIPISARYRGDARAYNRVSLTTGAGTQLLAGRDILVGAYKGSVSASGKGTNHNPYLAIFNTTTSDDNSDTATTANVVLNGTVYAGINNSQEITIGLNGSVTLSARPYPFAFTEVAAGDVATSFISYNDRKLRYDIANTYNPYQDIVSKIATALNLGESVVRARLQAHSDMFAGTNPTNEVRRQIETFVNQVYTGSVPDQAVSSVAIGSIMASAGSVTINADTLSGTASVTARGAPRIDIVNNGMGYVLLNKLLLTSNDGGHVDFTGAASGASAPGITVTTGTGPAKPEISVRSTWGGFVDHLGNVTVPAATPDIYFLGDVSNLTGAVTVRNAVGNVTILGNLFEAATVDMQIPRGNFTVNQGTGSIYDTNSSVISQWRGNQYRPMSAAQAVMAVATYMEGPSNYSYSDGNHYLNNAEFTARTIVQNYFSGGYGGLYSHIWFKLYDDGVDEDAIATQTGEKSYWDEGSFRGTAYDGGDSSGPFGYLIFDVIQRQGLLYTANAASSPPPSVPQIVGGSIIISAGTINVNGTIQSGFANSWSVNIGNAAQSTIATYRNDAALRAANAGRFIELATSVNGLDSAIRAYYDVSNDRIELQNVVQGAGGRVYLNGGIISTSTTGASQGLIRINGGYATVNVSNTTGTGLVVNTINTGVSTSSTVEIVDHYKMSNGAPTRTWYVYDVSQANAVSVYQQTNGTNNTDYRNATLIGSSNNQVTSYNPQADLLYRWIETATAVRAMNTTPHVLSEWQWESTAADPYTTSRSVIVGAQAENFRETVSGTATFTRRDNHPIESSWGTDFDGTWYQDTATRATITLTNTVKASNAIGIEFVGGSNGQVSINSNATVQVNGVITNYNGSTAITTSGADSAIVAGRDGFVSGRSVTLTGAGGIGTASKAVGVQTYGGTLTASSVDRDINIDVRGSLSIASVKVLGSGLGNVDLRASEDITAAAGYNIGTPIVVGRSIRIESASGAIGARTASNGSLTSINPIVVQAGGVLDSSSSTGAYLVQSRGDLRVGRVTSNGTIFLAAAASDGQAANILGGVSRSGPSAEETARLQALWQSLNLLGDAAQDGTFNPDGTPNTETFAGSAAVHGYEAMVTRAYQDYWQLRNLAFDASGNYSIGAVGLTALKAQIAARRGADASTIADADVQAEATRRFGAARFILGLSTDNSTVDLPADQLATLTGAPVNTGLTAALQAYDAGYAYELDAGTQLHALLTSGSTWTRDQLTYTIDRAANPASNTPQPTLAQLGENIGGRDVILYAPNGSIGSLGAPRTFVFASDNLGALSPEDRAAISAAGPGDLQVATRTLAGGVTEYTITLAEQDLIVANGLGNTTAKAKTSIYLGSHVELKLGGVAAELFPTGALAAAAGSAGVQTTSGGAVRLEAGGDIVSGAAGQTAIAGNITRLTLISETGSIGRVGLPGVNPALNANALLVAITGGGTLDLAQASQGIFLRQTSGDLILGNIAGGSGAQAAVQLDADGSIYAQAQFTDRTVPHILGSSLDLRAGGSVSFNGGTLQPLQVAITGPVTGHSAGDFSLFSPTVSMTVGAGTEAHDTITTDGNLVLDTAGGALTLNRAVSAGGRLTLIAGGLVSLADTVTVTATAGDIVVTAGSLGMGAGAAILGARLIDITSTGNAVIGRIASTLDTAANATAPVIRIAAGLSGSIRSNGDLGANLVTALGGGVALTAGDAIDITVDTSWLTASANTGNVTIRAVNGLVSSLIESTLAAVSVTGAGDLDLASVKAGTSAGAVSSGGSVKIGTLNAGTSATIEADDEIEIAALDAGADVTLVTTNGSIDATTLTSLTAISLTAGGLIDIGTLRAGTTLTSSAGTDTTIDSLTAGASLDVVSGGLVDITTADATTQSAKVESTGGKVKLDSLTAGTSADIDAHTDIEATTLVAGTSLDATATSGQIAVITAESGGSQDWHASGNIGFTTLRTTGSTGDLTMLSSGGNIAGNAAGSRIDAAGHAGLTGVALTLDEVDAGSAELTATGTTTTGNIAANSLTTGGAAALRAGGAITIGTLDIGTTLTSLAGTTTTFTDVDAGTSIDVTAAGLVEIATAQTGTGFAKVRSTGGKVKLGTLSAGGLADIDAQTDIEATTLETGASASLNAGGAVTIGTLDIDTTLTSLAGTTTTFTTLDAGSSIDVAATGLVRLVSATAGAGASVRSTGGAVDIGTLVAGASAFVNAAAGITAQTVATGGNASLTTGGMITLATLDAGGGVTLNAARLLLSSLTAGGNAGLNSATSINADTLDAGGSLVSSAGATANLRRVRTGGSMAIQAAGGVALDDGSAGGTAALTSTGGAVTVNRFLAGGGMALRAASTIDATLLSSGGSMTFAAARVLIGTAAAGGDMTIDSPQMDGADLAAGGLMSVSNGAAGSIRLRRASAASFASRGSAVFDAQELRLGASGSFAADLMRIGRLTHTGTGQLALDFTGAQGGSATNLSLSLSAADVAIGDYRVIDSTIDTDGTLLSIARGYVQGEMTLRTAVRRILLNNRRITPVPGFDVQLFQPTYSFRLKQENFRTTTNALIVQFGPGSEVFFERDGVLFQGLSLVRELETVLASATAGQGEELASFSNGQLQHVTATFMARFLSSQTQKAMIVREDEDEPAVNTQRQ